MNLQHQRFSKFKVSMKVPDHTQRIIEKIQAEIYQREVDLVTIYCSDMDVVPTHEQLLAGLKLQWLEDEVMSALELRIVDLIVSCTDVTVGADHQNAP